MPHKDPVNWPPISEMPLMIDGALEDTREHLQTLTEARTRPHVLDDATIDRTQRVHAEQMEFFDIYASRSAAGGLDACPPIKHTNWTGLRDRTESCGP